MPLTDEELNKLELCSYACAHAPRADFAERTVPTLSGLSEGELWALAGMLLFRGLDEPAGFVAQYARRVRSGQTLEPRAAWDNWEKCRSLEPHKFEIC
jgi:hypothetical protein